MRFSKHTAAVAVRSAFERGEYLCDAKGLKPGDIAKRSDRSQILNGAGVVCYIAGPAALGLALNRYSTRGDTDTGQSSISEPLGKIALRLSNEIGSGVKEFANWDDDSVAKFLIDSASNENDSNSQSFWLHINQKLMILEANGGDMLVATIEGVGTTLGSQFQAGQEKTCEMLENRFGVLQEWLLDRLRENGKSTAPSLVQSKNVNAARLTSRPRKLVMNGMEPEKTVAGKGGTVKKPGPTKNLAAKTQTKSNTFKAKNVEGGAAFSKQEISDWKRQATRGNGDPEASYQLSLAYANGWGVKQSDTQAKVYLALASKGGHKEAGILHRNHKLPFAAKVAGPEHATEGRKVLSLVGNGASGDGDSPKALNAKEATVALQGSNSMSMGAPSKAQTEHTASREVAPKPTPPAVSTLSLMEHGGMHSALLSPPDARVDMVTTPGASEGLRSALRSPSPIRNPSPTASGVVTKSTPSAAAQSGGNGGTSPCKPHYESKWIKALSERKEHMPIISECTQTPLGPKILFSEADCPASRGTFRREVNDILGNSTRVPTTQTPQKTANSPSVQTPGQNAERLQQVRDMVSQRKLHRSSFEHPVKDGDLLRACKACSPRYSPVRKSPSLRSPLSTLTNR